MKFLNSYDIQFLFLDYFKKNYHHIVDGCSIIPPNDNSLLFTNSGMVQFKDFFLGNKNTQYKNVATIQTCIRAGGKHNDLSNVGYTFRHHTLFEMLGNFSFGSYFKQEAIFYSWFFLTHVLFILKDKLYITVYEHDFDSKLIWFEKIKISEKNLTKLGKKDNFWMMGNYGPCGPCTEIFYDHGDFLEGLFDSNGNFENRYVEIWNLVFMEFNFCESGMENLSTFCVDTGMGLERISAVMQNVYDNYEINIFKDIKKLIIKSLLLEKSFINDSRSINVICDHLRCISCMIFYGITPSNDGRSYVLRKIIRRAAIHLKKLNIFDAFLHKLLKVVILNLKYYNFLYPVLNDVEKILFEEEVKFNETLNYGLKKLNEIILLNSRILGKDSFILYDTYGFPIDLIIEIAKEYNLSVDVDDFYRYMLLQKNTNHFNKFYFTNDNFVFKNTNFLGYNFIHYISKIKKIILDGKIVNILKNVCKCILILDNSPFYFESGGQVGDKGVIFNDHFIFFVENVRNINGIYVHFGTIKYGYIIAGEYVKSCVDFLFRKQISMNHSATHIINYVLKNVLSKNIKQVGSYIDNNKLRFDFLYNCSLNIGIINSIEFFINKYIFNNLFVTYDFIDFVEAKKKNIVYLDNDNYEEKVRVVYIGNFLSSELCSGTHINSTGEIGLLKILSFSSIASGVKRIEAVTGLCSLLVIQEKFSVLENLKLLFNCDDNFLEIRIKSLVDKNNILDKRILKLKSEFINVIEKNIFDNMLFINNINLLIYKLFFGNINLLKDISFKYENLYLKGIIFLVSVEENILNVFVSINENLFKIFNSVFILKYFLMKIGGFGGGDRLNAIGGYKNYKNIFDINFMLKDNFEFLKKCII